MLKDTGAPASLPCRLRGYTTGASWETCVPRRCPSKCRFHLEEENRIIISRIYLPDVYYCVRHWPPTNLILYKYNISFHLVSNVFYWHTLKGKSSNDPPKAWMHASTSSSTVADCFDNMDSIFPFLIKYPVLCLAGLIRSCHWIQKKIEGSKGSKERVIAVWRKQRKMKLKLFLAVAACLK